ncbi:hypothetical protein MuYL_0598 [Mucilaginibacter xinganensis]|uniref:Uncharacterized protein n=1 Tax=Mucilaginibacter xinganensis TaxID=1234841 RepID=A0A223NSK9_9SPHI|nr:hypothetical protein MuYL_0598 [Mucilaginibacter xinganensis]
MTSTWLFCLMILQSPQNTNFFSILFDSLFTLSYIAFLSQ